MKALLMGLGVLVAAGALSADTLRLKNGTTVDGTFLGGDSREVRFLDPNGSVKNYPVSDVAAIDFGGSRAASAEKPPVTRQTTSSNNADLPAGTVVTVRTIDSIDSDVAGVGERFRASLDQPVIVDGKTVVPASADAILRIARVEQSGTLRGKDELALELAALVINGKEYELASNYAELESKGKTSQTAKTAAGGAALGAIIGAIAGGGKGAAVGAAAGGGAGTVYSATRGEKVQVPSETLLTFSLREPVDL